MQGRSQELSEFSPLLPNKEATMLDPSLFARRLADKGQITSIIIANQIIPDELIYKILDHLTLQALGRLAQVSHQFKNKSESNVIWKEKARRDLAENGLCVTTTRAINRVQDNENPSYRKKLYRNTLFAYQPNRNKIPVPVNPYENYWSEERVNGRNGGAVNLGALLGLAVVCCIACNPPACCPTTTGFWCAMLWGPGFCGGATVATCTEAGVVKCLERRQLNAIETYRNEYVLRYASS